jgi:hypothetical protein
MKVYAPASVTVSGLNATGWDADLVVPAAFIITVNHVTETTPAHGTVFNAVLDAADIGNTLKGLVMVHGGGTS